MSLLLLRSETCLGTLFHPSDRFCCCSRISFPVAVAILPLESVLTLTLFGILNQNAGGSPDSNKQRKAPEQLGKASVPLFDFRG